MLCTGQESQGYQPEELNKKALEITQRVKQKLTGMIKYSIKGVMLAGASASDIELATDSHRQ